MTALLEGILVLDFSEYIAGPYCGMLLADMGAEVIKIEPPDGGEERRLGNVSRYRGNTRMALTLNRGKRGLCLDLRKEAGRKIVYRLAERADVVIQNFAPGVAKDLGIDYDTLSALNRGLIFVSSTAFGEIGPYRSRKGFDIIAHAASGIMSAYADEEGNPRGPGGNAYIDIGTGMLNALSAVACLFARTRSGEGQKIETSLFNTGIALQAANLTLIDRIDREQHQEALDILKTAHQKGMTHTQIIDALSDMRLRYEIPGVTRPIEVPDCNHRPSDRHIYPYYRIYETANGYIGIAALNRKQRQQLCEVLEMVDEGLDIDIGNTPDDIYYHQKDLMRRIEERLKGKTNEEWIEALESAGVPCGPVNYSTHLFEDPQAREVNMIWELENSELGTYKMAGHPIRFLKTPATSGKGAPTLGEDTVPILEELGYDEDEIAGLREQEVIR